MLNASGNELSLSRIDFNDDKSSLEIERVNETIKKIEDLAKKADGKIKENNKRRAST